MKPEADTRLDQMQNKMLDPKGEPKTILPRRQTGQKPDGFDGYSEGKEDYDYVR